MERTDRLAMEAAWEWTLKRLAAACPRLLLLLLIAGAATGRALADSPKWADEDMLLPWPAVFRSGPEIGSQSSIEPLCATDVPPPSESTAPVPPGPLMTQRGQSFPAARPSSPCFDCFTRQVLPAGLLYPTYIAGEKEPRMAAAWLYERDRGSVFEATIGGRFGLLRYGTPGPINPQGWQWDLEGAAMLRQDPDQELDVEATDFRVGTLITRRLGPTALKAGYYHVSSHVGDEFLLRNPAFPRLNYVRDSLIAGVYHYLTDALAIYGEVAYAFNTDGGAEPWELQFGMEYAPYDPTTSRGAPFAAVNGHLREEFDFGGSVNVLAGWQWIGRTSGHRLRIGGQYYNGKEIQWSFFDESVQFLGGGIWFDF